ATLCWLRDRLRGDLCLAEDQIAVLHGGLSDTEQQQIVESFKQSNSPIRVLVTGDVASEGVNLHQQCHELIHFDIPWSLIRIEQRNGRIDRYGQRHSPQITTLLLEPSNPVFRGDLRVLSRLLKREQEAHEALGDAGSLMGRYSASAEEEDIKLVLAGRRDFNDVVRSVDELSPEDSLACLLASLNAPTDDKPPPAKFTEPSPRDR
ncbi:SWF/SNF helicase family protein, partial [Cutibacterium acnes]|uniref:helicase-related protein n=1 Tax=Cutibacterium acnes TaxID=1747 RepID=UPI0020CF83D9